MREMRPCLGTVGRRHSGWTNPRGSIDQAETQGWEEDREPDRIQFLSFVYFALSVCHVHAGASRDQKRALDPLQLEL